MLEAVSTSLLLVSNLLGTAGSSNTTNTTTNATDTETPEEQAERLAQLAQSLRLATFSANILMVAVLLPLAVSVYNSFLVPLVHIIWKAEGKCHEIIGQIIMT